MDHKSELLQNSLTQMKGKGIDFNVETLNSKSATDLLQKNLLNQTLTNIRYLYGTLVLEFGILDENSKGKYSVVCECDWKFQQEYSIPCHGNMEKADINALILSYKDKKLNDIFVIDVTGELYLDFGDVFFTTLSTFNNHIGRQFWFNKVGDGYERYISSDQMGTYIYGLNKKSTEI